MVQYIRCVHPHLQALGFGQLHGLAYVGIEPPPSCAEDLAITHGRECSWHSVLQKGLTGLRILNRVKRAKRLQSRCNRCTLTISLYSKRAWLPVRSCCRRSTLECYPSFPRWE